MTSNSLEPVPKHPSHPDVPRPSDAELVELARGVCRAIDACGASPELTDALTLAGNLFAYLKKPVTGHSPATNPVHLAVDLSHAIARLSETAPSLRSTEQGLVNGLINSMATKATALLQA